LMRAHRFGSSASGSDTSINAGSQAWRLTPKDAAGPGYHWPGRNTTEFAVFACASSFGGCDPEPCHLKSAAGFNGFLSSWPKAGMHQKSFYDKHLARISSATLYRNSRFIPQVLRFKLR